MPTINVKLNHTPPNTTKTPPVQLQVDKGKKQTSSVYIEQFTFDCIRGVIWNKHREFGSQKRTYKIHADDWRRILQGFKSAMNDLAVATNADQLTDILSIPKHLLTEKDTIFDQKLALHQFIKTLVDWIETHLKKAKYILIIQND